MFNFLVQVFKIFLGTIYKNDSIFNFLQLLLIGIDNFIGNMLIQKMDLIDFQLQPDRNFKFICVYQ